MMLTTSEVAARVKLSRCSLWRMITAGTFPPARQLSPGKRAWLEDDVAEWERARPTASWPEPKQLREARMAR